MRLSRERLQREETATGFRVEILEKVAQLLGLLDGFNRHPYLKGRLALKGGTALNLFVFDVPRLSIDIDLNYIGQLDREATLAERPEIERALKAVCGRTGIVIDHVPGAHPSPRSSLCSPTAGGTSAGSCTGSGASCPISSGLRSRITRSACLSGVREPRRLSIPIWKAVSIVTASSAA